MSSLLVRQEVTGWLNANFSAMDWHDLSYHFDIDEVAAGQRDPFMMVQFASPGEVVSELYNDCWREDGIIYFHVTGPVGGDNMQLMRDADDLKTALRGERLGNTVIESISPATNVDGASFQWDGNWTSFTMMVQYQTDHPAE